MDRGRGPHVPNFQHFPKIIRVFRLRSFAYPPAAFPPSVIYSGHVATQNNSLLK